jgi:hypothetical protein
MSMWKAMYCFGVLALFGGTLIAADNDPFAGTWKLDLEKSKYSSNQAKPKDLTLTIADEGDNRKITLNGTAADGSPIKLELTAPIKGGPVEVTGAPPNNAWDAVVSKYISPTAYDFVYSKDGKEVATRHIKLGKDHQTFAASFRGPDIQGKTVTQDDFWRKQ